MLFSKFVALIAFNQAYAQYGSGFKGDILETKIQKVPIIYSMNYVY